MTSQSLIVAVGSLGDGHKFYGPYESVAGAQSVLIQAGDAARVLKLDEPEMVAELKAELDEIEVTEPSIVITGNPVDGLFFYGPFPNSDEASHWAGVEHDGQDWWITELKPALEMAINCEASPTP